VKPYRHLVIPLFLLWPVIGLGYSWIATEIDSREGVVWEVPIAGYDPRDLLRGHYVQYNYRWPGLETDEALQRLRYSGNVICIRGDAPDIETAQSLNPYDIAFEAQSANCDSLVEYNPWSEEGASGLDRDRIFLPQERAREYQDKLMDPKLDAVARVRVNNSNYLIPVDIIFRPTAGTDNASEEST